MIQEQFSFEFFCQQFNTEQTCAEVLFQARWPDGFRCPKCSHAQFYLIRSRNLPLYECGSCRRQTSVISGTIMEGSRTSLSRWFQAMFLLSQPSGISASRLSEIIQVTYKTAWLIARKIRHALQQADSQAPLRGIVRMNHLTYGYEWYPDAQQPLLIGSSLNMLNEPQYIKIKQPDPIHVKNESRRIENPGIEAFIQDHTEGLDISISTRNYMLHPVMNSLRQIGREATQWLNDTFHGIGPKHLQAYLDEFCFRWNLKLRSTSVFGQLLHWCAATPVAIYKVLTQSKPVLPRAWVAYGSKAKWKGKYLTLWSA